MIEEKTRKLFMRKRLGIHESMTTTLRRPILTLAFLKTPYFGETLATATTIPTVPLKVPVVISG